MPQDFTRKARFVAGGHTTEAPACMTYSSVVSRDSVRLAFLIAGLNDLEVSACDVGNAYLNADCREKVWFEAGLECGIEDKGKVMIIGPRGPRHCAQRRCLGLEEAFKTYVWSLTPFDPT
jgi:hypothetical protein